MRAPTHIFSLFFVVSAFTCPAIADDCVGFRASTKKIPTPLYRTADFTSEQLLSLRELKRLCVVGQQGDFAIIQRTEDLGVEALPKLLFVREVDIFRTQPVPSLPKKRTEVDLVRDYYQGIQSGIVPEDGLLPYRPLLRLWAGSETKEDPSASKPASEEKSNANEDCRIDRRCDK